MKKTRSYKKTLLMLSILLSLFFVLSAWSKNDKWEERNDELLFAPDQILVKFKPDTPRNVRAALHKWHGGKVVDFLPELDVHVVQIPRNKVREKVRDYENEAFVEFAEPDYIAFAILTPDDTDFEKQWGMLKIQAPLAWDNTQGSPTIKIAICDTGIDQNHEDHVGKIGALDNKDFTGSGTDDKFGHGTHVAGIAAAVTDNGKGVAGVGFNSSLMNVKVLGNDGSGNYSWIANGIRWAADHGAKVINLSLGGYFPSSTLKNAVNYAWGKGCVLVAAAGNDGIPWPLYPANYANCIAVAATDRNDAKAKFSNYGSGWVDIAAPGVDIYSTLPNHDNEIGILNYGSLSGTSMATPHVAGVAALVWATTKYGTSNSAVRSRIQNTADQAGSMWSKYRIKRVNAFKAVAP